MTREEAIDILMSANVWNDEERTAWEVLIPELAENEDERIRKELIGAFEAYDIESSWNGIPIRSIFAWLEKQKESLHIPETCKENADSFTDIKDRNIRGCIGMALADISESRFKMYGVTLKECLAWLEKQKEPENTGASTMAPSCWAEEPSLQKEPKPAWSEEDEEILDGLISLYSNTYSGEKWPWKKGGYITYGDVVNFLKSLRPSWKPSEHQMNILKAVKEYVGRGSGYWGEGLGSLIEDLEKL